MVDCERRRFARRAALGALVAALLAPQAADAQTPGRRAEADRARTERLVPHAGADWVSHVRIVSAEEIASSGARYLVDVLRALPGVWVVAEGGPGSGTSVRLRGAHAHETMVLIDDVRVDDAGFDWGRLSARVVERVEIAYGGQSAHWGSGAGGGVINIVTRPEGEGGLAFAGGFDGGFNYASPAGFLRAVNRASAFNFAADFSFDATRDHDHTRGARSAWRHTHDPVGVGEEDDSDSSSVGMSFSSRRADGFAMGLTARSYRDNADYDDTDLRVDFPPNGGVANFNYGLPYDIDARAERAGVLWRANAGFTRPGGGLALELASVAETLDDRVESATTSSERERRRAVAQAYWRLEGEAVDFTIAPLFEHVIDEATQNAVSRKITTFGYGAEARVAILDKAFGSLAFRRDEEESAVSGDTNTNAYRIGMAYDLDEVNVRLTTNYARSVRRPALADVFLTRPRFAPNANLKAELSRTFDVGAEFVSPSGRTAFGFSYFASDVEDRIDYRNREESLGGVIEPVNVAGVSRYNGVELSYVLHLGGWGRFDFGWTALSSAETDDANLVGAPQDVVRAALRFDGARFDVPIQATIAYTGGLDLRDLRYTDPVTRNLVALDDYARLDAYVQTSLAPGVYAYMRFDNFLGEDLVTSIGRTEPSSAAIGIRAQF